MCRVIEVKNTNYLMQKTDDVLITSKVWLLSNVDVCLSIA